MEANKEAKKAEKTRQKLEAEVLASDKKAIDKEEKLRQKSTAKLIELNQCRRSD
ncbi:hypothetical protein AG0111_0g6718 [Alternaria gaisen]|uniref:Uncharacterized protein n=1 Tax=Alternaria gaisen TaxID=167740 RepID=A0ACB6FKZ4_9PLEO|nr:hypothetical protein AG0111_0g6718 [Alternaria gaisen]